MTRPTHRLGSGVTIAALAAIAYLTLTPAPSSGWGGFEPPWWCLWCGTLGVVDTAANILLFVPLGAGLRLLGLRPWRAILAALVVTVAIEALQLSFVAGRDANLRDVLTNTLGAWLGFAVWPYLPRMLRPSSPHAAWAAALVATLWVLSRLATGALLRPSPPSGSLVAQIAPTSVYPSDFAGIVHEAAINGESIGVGPLRAQDRLIRRWNNDTLTMQAIVTARSQQAGLASVVSVLTRLRQEAFVFGAQGPHLVLRTRMRASDFQLRSPKIMLADAMRVGESVTLTGALQGTRVSLGSTSARGSRHTEVALSAGLGWILVSPFDWPLDASAPWWSGLLAGGWAGILVWYARTARHSPWIWARVAVTGVLAMLLPPWLLHAAAPPLQELIGMSLGAGVGSALWQRLGASDEDRAHRGP